MAFRVRYVTICQQVLVTAVTAAVGLSAAGVMTLQIVSPASQTPRSPTDAQGMLPAINVTDGYAATEAVTPTVREIKISPVAAHLGRLAGHGKVAANASPVLKIAAASQPVVVHGYGTVGVTWKSGIKLAENAIRIQLRTFKAGVWSGWSVAQYHDDHGPDADTSENGRKARPGTDPVVIGNVDKVQMRASTLTGTAPADLELAVIDPGATPVVKQAAAIDTAKLSATDRDATSSAPIESTGGMGGTSDAAAAGDAAAADLDLAAMKTAPKPLIYSRAQWGANEAMRDPTALHYGTIQTGFIHHTVNANDYTPEEVPALLRGIYAYHTQSRGWSDIGYNFLVDRFGRIWEGRYGGVDRAVVGAHTLGYNEYSFAMSAIGNYDITQPPQVVLDAYASLFAWKLSLYNIPADATHLLVKDHYLNAINGHRDVGQTACPGIYLYVKIPSIRIAAAAIQQRAQIPADPVDRVMIAPPKGLVAPTAKAAASVLQPTATLPLRSNLAGSSWPDLVVKANNGAISVVPTEGMLSYAGPITSKGDWSALGIIAAVGDVTGDGKSDLIGKNRKTGVARVFPGDGAGHVSRIGIDATMAFADVTSIDGVGDFNHDGKNDVVGVDKSHQLLLFAGTGHGTFAAPVVLRKNWNYPWTAGVGDFNGDKQADLMVVSGKQTLYLFPGAAKGTALGKPVLVGAQAAPVTALLGWGDLTGDKLPDIVVRDAGTGLSRIRAGTGTGALSVTYGPFGSLAGLGQVSMAPMVGTAAADVVARDPAGHLIVVPNNGLKNISAPLPTNLKVPGATQLLDVGDWNSDGYSDVIVRTNGGNLLVLYPGLGNGKFGQPRSLGLGWKNVTHLSAVGDVTGDGLPDLIGQIGNGPMTIFPGWGNKAFKAPVLAPASLRTFNQIGSVAWSPRGAAFLSSDGSLVPLAGSELDTALRAANGTANSVYDTYIGVGDANGDGVADVLAREKGTGTIWLLPGKTSGGFAPRMWVANGFAGYQLIG
jgi:hypothetical protein